MRIKIYFYPNDGEINSFDMDYSGDKKKILSVLSQARKFVDAWNKKQTPEGKGAEK